MKMVSWYTITITTAVLYLVPVKFLITTFIDYYRNKPIKLHRKTAIVVLDTIGMNFEKARELAKKGAKIIVASNDAKKAELAKKELVKITKNNNVSVKQVDCTSKLSLLEFSKHISETLKSIDILINNDGFDISDMELDFYNQQLAVERFRNHCLNFLYEDIAGDSAKYDLHTINFQYSNGDDPKKVIVE